MSLNTESNFKLPLKEKINYAISAFSKKEWLIFAVLVLGLLVSSLVILQMLNKSLMVEVPFPGGSFSEGIVGTPRFVNPVLASSPADLDMVALIYSGLMRKNGESELVPDLAEKYEISKDGLNYIFTLKNNIYFHNDEPVTADDVVFTIERVKNSVIKSPQKVNWDGVTVTKKDNRTLEFTLGQPNPNFLENATLGIMPQKLWESDSTELNPANTAPVGSGPYKVEEISKESSGVINAYWLVAFKKFALGEPYIKEIGFRFYQNEEELVQALEGGDVNQISSVSPDTAELLKEKGYRVESKVLPRVFGLFFNQNKNQIFIEKAVVRAINDAIDKEKIIREVLRGYGSAIDDPIPTSMAKRQEISPSKILTREETVEKIKAALEKEDWKAGGDGVRTKTITDKNKRKTTMKLEFSIFTGNAPELAQTAELIKNDLAEVGIRANVKTFEVGNLNQSVIRPREYDALLFGQVIYRQSDLYAFWHSSQRKEPGFNVAMYTNPRADKLLEDAFVALDSKTRAEKYSQFEAEVRKDMPAVFLYSPNFIYIVAKNLQGLTIDHIASPTDRFKNIFSWFVKTENVWKIFAKK